MNIDKDIEVALTAWRRQKKELSQDIRTETDQAGRTHSLESARGGFSQDTE